MELAGEPNFGFTKQTTHDAIRRVGARQVTQTVVHIELAELNDDEEYLDLDEEAPR